MHLWKKLDIYILIYEENLLIKFLKNILLKNKPIKNLED